VHFVVCDRKGEWVIVDMQNSQHPDYQDIKPTSSEGCNKLLVKRLEGYLKLSIADVLRETIRTSGIEAAVSRFNELRAKKDEYNLSEQEINSLGYEYLQSNKLKEAIEVFKLNVEAFPQSFNVYDSLGEAYAAAGEKELAVKNYEKSLELNPKSQSGIDALKKLKAQ
jgi:tetratricopeptide (TPR) repeat protein